MARGDKQHSKSVFILDLRGRVPYQFSRYAINRLPIETRITIYLLLDSAFGNRKRLIFLPIFRGIRILCFVRCVFVCVSVAFSPCHLHSCCCTRNSSSFSIFFFRFFSTSRFRITNVCCVLACACPCVYCSHMVCVEWMFPHWHICTTSQIRMVYRHLSINRFIVGTHNWIISGSERKKLGHSRKRDGKQEKSIHAECATLAAQRRGRERETEQG